ncbi:MAG TPA: hypothetical protein VFL12_01190 [Thermoanaerobaculia bacterium]|nr:hypothetical protein [Thermoanaerobaculia bacterium]
MKNVLVAAAVLGAAAALGAAETEKTIPMPKREQVVKINFAADKAKIDTLEIQHFPDEEDVEKAKTKDLNDTHLTFWHFTVENHDTARKAKMRIAVEVIGKDGSIVGKGDKSDTVDAGKLDDNIRVWVRMKTLDIVSARSAKLHLSIEPK